ncbi:MAG: hypothetical protein AB1668_02345 [Nanoarchaeota archaeon]
MGKEDIRRDADDVSNKLLAFLVGIGVLISLVSLIASLSSPTIIAGSSTGAAITNVTSGAGTTSLAVRANLVLTLIDSAIDLGTLEIGATNVSSDNVTDYFTVRNDGSVNFDVYAYGSTSPFTSSTGGADTLPNSYFQVNLDSTQSGILNRALNYSYTDVPSGVATKVLLLSALSKANTADEANIGIQVSIPDDEPAGSKSADITILAVAS